MCNSLKLLVINYLIVAFAAGCMTTRDGEVIQSNLLIMQKRLLEIEQLVVKEGEKQKEMGVESSKKIATASNSLDSLSQEIARLKGELEAIKIGVRTGEMPGEEADPDQETVAQKIRLLQERLSSVEETQIAILDLIKKDTKESDKSPSKKKLADHASVAQAYQKKRYKQIADEAPALLNQSKISKKKEISFLLAESLFKLGRFREAALMFNEILEAKELKNEKIKMHMRLGDCFRQLGDNKAAVAFYKDLIEIFPESKEAKQAAEYVKKLSPSSQDKT